jgi:glucose-1-phosphate cytidylyltransferase
MATKITPVSQCAAWMNGGFFILEQSIFDYMRDGEDLACEPFRRLIDTQRLATYRYEGYWGCMDTFKEKQLLDDMYARGDTPWELWKQPYGKRLPKDCGPNGLRVESSSPRARIDLSGPMSTREPT